MSFFKNNINSQIITILDYESKQNQPDSPHFDYDNNFKNKDEVRFMNKVLTKNTISNLLNIQIIIYFFLKK